MGFEDLFSGLTVSATGLLAERIRMDTAAQNIANANTTGGPGGVYRRREVLFEPLLEERMRRTGDRFRPRGVRVLGVVEDPSELQRVHQPGHPEAGRDGFRTLPNVQLPMEMVDLISASRAYEANLAAMRTWRDMAQKTLAILR